MLASNIKDLFNSLKKNKSLIITIGNIFRADDGVGPYIFNNLNELPENITCINAGDRPENIIDAAVIVNPDITLIIDAANFNGKPGEAKIITEDLIPDTTLSTHSFPPKIITKILKEDTGSQIYFLGIQPLSFDYKEGLTKEVKKTADEIVSTIKNIF